MKKVKDWNDVPKAELKKLAINKHSRITFQLTGMPLDETTRIPTPPRVRAIPSQDRVQIGDEFYSIGYIDRVNADGSPVFGNITFTSSENGMKALNPKSAKHAELIEYLLLSNYNASNPNRDTSVAPMYKVLDATADAKAENDTIDELTEALVLAKTMKVAELKAFGASRSWDLKQGTEVLKNRVKKFAKNNPRGFLAAADPKNVHIRAVLSKAETDGIISFNRQVNGFVYKDSGDIITTFARSKNFDQYTAFAAWMNEDDAAGPVFAELEKATGFTKSKPANKTANKPADKD
jgi:hypothetical protein